jgi:hypothetical protein
VIIKVYEYKWGSVYAEDQQKGEWKDEEVGSQLYTYM